MAQLQLQNGAIHEVARDANFGWYVLEGPRPKLGSAVSLDGVPRDVVVVAKLADRRYGIGLLPDFDDAGCEACGSLETPPTPAYCRTACRAGRGGPPFEGAAG